MSTATKTAKRCVNCNKDVNGQQRMKDSSGQYWCVKCGEADRMKKGQTGDPCGGCGENFPAAKLTKYGAARLCSGCYRNATKGAGLLSAFSGGGGDGEGNKKKVLIGVAVMGALALYSIYNFISMHHH